jgi:hypothetical protein
LKSRLYIKETEITPLIEFDSTENIFRIVGKSLPEDVKNFYSPVIHWLDEYSKEPNADTHLTIDFEYFNTSSSKMILIILNKIKEIHRSGKIVLVTWIFPQFDAEIEDAGEEFAELLNIPFEFIPKI